MNRKVWSAERYRFRLMILSFLAFLCFVAGSTAFAATWYVAPLGSGGDDANPGTVSQPFYTFWPAVTSAQPGDTILVRGGTYHYPAGQWL